MMAENEKTPLLVVKDLKKWFSGQSGAFARKKSHIKAVDGVSFSLDAGESLGIVGESGCGKSTMGRSVLRLLEPSGGQIIYKGKDFTKMKSKELRKARSEMQIIFQDPYASLNPRMTIGEIISEPLNIQLKLSKEETRKRVLKTMEVVGLNPKYYNRYPHEFSGGQRQRIGIARSIVLEPKLIVCDEPVSALDVSIQAQVINLMVEIGSKEDMFENPQHPYTRALLSAIPIPERHIERKKIILEGDLPSPANPPSGCVFHTRCYMAQEKCSKEVPEFRDLGNGHCCACHFCGQQTNE